MRGGRQTGIIVLVAYDGSAANLLRYRFHELMDRRGLTVPAIAHLLADSRKQVSTQTIYNTIEVRHLPHAQNLLAICAALRATTDETLALTQLSDEVRSERRLWQRAQTQLPASADIVDNAARDTDFLFQRFDGRSGQHKQCLRWSFHVGPDRWLDRVVEHRLIWCDGVRPLEAVLAQPGSEHERDVETSDLAARVHVLRAPTGSPDDLSCHLYVGNASDHHIGLLAVFAPPVTNRGWLEIQFTYRWPGLWDSLRDPSDRVSHGSLGFVGDVASGAVEVVSHLQIHLAVDAARTKPQTSVRSGMHRGLYTEQDPSHFELIVSR